MNTAAATKSAPLAKVTWPWRSPRTSTTRTPCRSPEARATAAGPWLPSLACRLSRLTKACTAPARREAQDERPERLPEHEEALFEAPSDGVDPADSRKQHGAGDHDSSARE